MLQQVTGKEAITYLNDIDLFAVALYYAQEYSGNTAELERAGKAIGKVAEGGYFRYNSIDNNERDAHLDKLFDLVEQALRGELPEQTMADEWWKANVLDLDQVGMTAIEADIFKEELFKNLKKVQGIGAADVDAALKDGTIGEYLTEAGNHFLYLFMTPAQLQKLPKVFTTKKVYQQRVYNWAKSFYVGIYGTEAKMQTTIRNGIMKEYNMTPEAVCKKIASGEIKSKGVGDLAMFITVVTYIIKIITALAPIIIGVVGAIYDYKSRVEIGQQQAVDKAIISAAQADGKDFDDMDYKEKDNTSRVAKAAVIGAGLLGLMFFTGQKK